MTEAQRQLVEEIEKRNDILVPNADVVRLLSLAKEQEKELAERTEQRDYHADLAQKLTRVVDLRWEELATAQKRIKELENIGKEYIAKTDPVLVKAEQMYDELAQAKERIKELEEGLRDNKAFEQAVKKFAEKYQGRPHLTDKLEGFSSGWIAARQLLEEGEK